MKHYRYIFSLSIMLVLACCIQTAAADTYVVSPDGTGDFSTIQEAITAAVAGDIIELTDGTFRGAGNRDIDYLGKAITVRSQNGDPKGCVIDCEASASEHHRGFSFISDEESDSVLEGLTITNGYLEYPERGGGVFCQGTSPTIINCIFSEHTSFEGGGLHNTGGANVTVIGCIFTGNSATSGGGMSSSSGSFPTVSQCTFYGNSAITDGGGFSCYWSTTTMDNCTFYDNTAPQGSGVFSGYGSAVDTQNCIIAFNNGGEGCGIGSFVSPTLTCCDIYGNPGGDWVGDIAGQYGINGNIAEDPLFCDAENADFMLDYASPCAPFTPPNPECDLIGACPAGCGFAFPVLDVKCNGEDGPVFLVEGDNVELTIELQARDGEGYPADMWVLVQGPGWWSYQPPGGMIGWWHDRNHAYYTGPLMDFAETVFSSAMPVGSYTAYLGLDAEANGELDLPPFDYDLVEIEVLPAGTETIYIWNPADSISGPAMVDAMDLLGAPYVMETGALPGNLSPYSAVFVCLGIFPMNIMLDTNDGDILAAYLDGGGNLYMEGGDTWYYDPSTSVHPYFHITGIDDGMNDTGPVDGVAGTFTEGMSFNYSGNNNYMDHLVPDTGAFTVLVNPSPAYDNGIAYDAATYHTVGCSFEFGGLEDGVSPSTKQDLMEQYLTFFGVLD